MSVVSKSNTPDWTHEMDRTLGSLGIVKSVDVSDSSVLVLFYSHETAQQVDLTLSLSISVFFFFLE